MARQRSQSTRSPRPSPSDAAPELPPTAALLALAAPARRPATRVKQQLLARIAAERAAAKEAAAPAWRFDSVRRREGWLAMPFPGVSMKELSVDEARNTALVLIEMAPGSRFPDHEHELSDEGMVLSGDVTTGGRRLRAGDYYFGPAGAKHEDIATVKGCTALVHLGASVWQRLRAQGKPVSV